jgi:transcriptional regulator with XRE-family HTH domain
MLCPVPRRSQRSTASEAKAIGKRLRELRSVRGMTQAELAERVSLTQTLVSDYEIGRLRMHAGLVVALAKALKVSADELLGLKELEQNGLMKDRRFMRRLPKIDRLPKRDKQHLLGTIDAVLRGSGIG